MAKAKPDRHKIKEMIKIIEDDGWCFARRKGSHLQYKHPIKTGIVTIPFTGINKNLELSILRQSGLKKGYEK